MTLIRGDEMRNYLNKILEELEELESIRAYDKANFHYKHLNIYSI